MDRGSFRKIIFYGLFVFCIFLFVIAIIRTVIGGKDVNFISLLSNLSKTDSYFSLSYNINANLITDDWGLFNFLRNFFNTFVYIFSFLGWLGVNLVNLILFVGQFIVYVFSF